MMPSPSGSLTFPQLLIRSGLLTDTELRDFLDQHPQATRSPELCSRLLVKHELLTEWQANKLAKGKHVGFNLGSYKLLSHIAKGGMSSLYAASHRKTGRKCALKILPPAKAEDEEASYLARFVREAKLASRLHHPNIIDVYDVMYAMQEGSRIYFMAMELLDGHDVYALVARNGAMPIREAVRIVRDVASGLHYAHSRGLVHRDIKPGNVFVTDTGEVKILDLGLAGFLTADSEESLTRTYNERVLGTADYLAPEQAVDSHNADARADLYALGCTLYYMLAGRPPFDEGTLPQRLLAHQTRHPTDIQQIRADVPDEVAEFLRQMMVKDRDDRIQTAAEVAEVAHAWLKAAVDSPQFDQEAKFFELKLPESTEEEIDSAQPPTDPIRFAETQMQAAQQPTANDVPAAPVPPKFTPEFESFMQILKKADRVDTVLQPADASPPDRSESRPLSLRRIAEQSTQESAPGGPPASEKKSPSPAQKRKPLEKRPRRLKRVRQRPEFKPHSNRRPVLKLGAFLIAATFVAAGAGCYWLFPEEFMDTLNSLRALIKPAR